MLENKQFILVKRPGGDFLENPASCFKEQIVKFSTEIPENTALVQNLYMSIDPTMRVWMTGQKTYIGVLNLGELMPALCIGKVIKSRIDSHKPGDIVMGMFGWQNYGVFKQKDLMKLPKAYPYPQHFLGVYGINGLTAYYGLFEIGLPKEGETVVVSTAAGAVGSIAVQLAKIKGCRVIGIAGGKDKCEYVKKECGADDCIDYNDFDFDSKKLTKKLAECCPKGVDVYFDNVGGWILDGVLSLINNYARIVGCGAISGYNSNDKEATRSALKNYGNMIMRRGKYQGFIYFDYAKKNAQTIPELMQYVSSGKLKFREDISEGLESAPSAMKKLFTGKNTGKTIVKFKEETAPKL